MSLFNMADLRARVPEGRRILGIDPGQRIIGLALSDISLRIASPYGSLPREKLGATARRLREIVEREGVAGLVAGAPLSLEGGLGPAAQAARDWLISLSGALALPAALWDERFSSRVANRMLISEFDVSRRRRGEIVDKIAAAYILQAALDAATPAVTRPA